MGIDDAVILGVDPGRDKVGFAFVDASGGLLLSGMVPAAETESFAISLMNRGARIPSQWLRERAADVETVLLRSVSLAAIGSGTCCRAVSGAFARACFDVAIVDERGTTLEARGLYWALHSPAWWQRLLPVTMRVPPRPLDDLAAWAIALRVVMRN